MAQIGPQGVVLVRRLAVVTVADSTKKSKKATKSGSTSKKKASGPVKVSRFFIEEQPRSKWWSWSKEELKELPKGAGAVLGVLDRRLKTADITVRAGYGIRHDQDVQQVWSEAQETYVDRPKMEHDHLMLHIDPPTTVAKLAEIMGLDAEFIRPMNKGGAPATTRAGGRVPGGWDSMLGYLIHENARDKHRYSPSEVVTLRGGDYQEIHAERYRAWRERGAFKQYHATTGTALYLAELARTGKVTKAQIMATDWMWDAYSIHTNAKSDASKMVDDAFILYGERQAYRAAAALKRRDFRTSVVYVHGVNGTGKSFAAEQLCDELVALSEQATGTAWQVYNPAAKHVFDTYSGQEIFFLDEARVDSMTSGEWLMLMDPDRASQQGARYRNKDRVAPRVIVITNTTPPLEFFFYAQKKGEIDEAMGQFIRRLTRVVEVHRDNPETPDESWRYSVSSVEHTDPYTHRLLTRRGVASFELNRTFVDEGEYTQEALYGVLAAAVDERCHDIDLSAIPALQGRVGRAAAELAAYRDRQSAAGPLAPLNAELGSIVDKVQELHHRIREMDADLVNVEEASKTFEDAEFVVSEVSRARRAQMEERAGLTSWRRELDSRAAGVMRRRAEVVDLTDRDHVAAEILSLAALRDRLDLTMTTDYVRGRLTSLGKLWADMSVVTPTTVADDISQAVKLNSLGTGLSDWLLELRDAKKACVAAGILPPDAPTRPKEMPGNAFRGVPVATSAKRYHVAGTGIDYEIALQQAEYEARVTARAERIRQVVSGGVA